MCCFKRQRYFSIGFLALFRECSIVFHVTNELLYCIIYHIITERLYKMFRH